MTPRQIRLARALLHAHRTHAHLALLFDYDGTLTPIVAHPRLARLDRAMRAVLRRLASRPDVSLGIISGRSLDDLRRLTRIPRAILAGTCGLEIEREGVALYGVARGPTRTAIRRIMKSLQSVLEPYRGAWIEDKQIALTVHYRAVAARQAARVRQCAFQVLGKYAKTVQWTEGPKAIEILPELGVNKGTAVRKIVRRLALAGPAVFYAGDATNDIEAFRSVRELGGLAAKIGGKPIKQAKHHLASPAKLREVLAWLEAELVRKR